MHTVKSVELHLYNEHVIIDQSHTSNNDYSPQHSSVTVMRLMTGVIQGTSMVLNLLRPHGHRSKLV